MNQNNFRGLSDCSCSGGVPAPTARAASAVVASRTMDFSRVRFSSSLQTRPVGELLQAIPLVKGAPIISEYTGSEGITNKISVQIQYLNADDVPEEAPLYDTGTNAPPSVATGLGATEIFYLARLGVYACLTG